MLQENSGTIIHGKHSGHGMTNVPSQNDNQDIIWNGNTITICMVSRYCAAIWGKCFETLYMR